MGFYAFKNCKNIRLCLKIMKRYEKSFSICCRSFFHTVVYQRLRERAGSGGGGGGGTAAPRQRCWQEKQLIPLTTRADDVMGYSSSWCHGTDKHLMPWSRAAAGVMEWSSSWYHGEFCSSDQGVEQLLVPWRRSADGVMAKLSSWCHGLL